MDLLSLQNGSDIRGIAITTENSQANLTDDAVSKIGAAFVVYLKKKLGKSSLTIAVGNDTRLSAARLFDRLCIGMLSQNAKVTYMGIASTPAMFMATVMDGYEYDASVMITASHLPYDRNGFKFFTKSGGFEKTDIKAVLELAGEIQYNESAAKEYDCRDIIDDYCTLLRKTIIKKADVGNMPLNGLHIITDCGNGAGGFFAEKVLVPLGADVSGSVFSEPDGTFPNHAPNPEDKTAMEVFSKAVISAKCDLGIIFDTDVDRSAVVLPDGKEINRNRLIALMTAIVKQEHENPVIITDSVTSTGLAQFITELGGTHVRFKRGYRNVINEAIRLCNTGVDACLAIETSGHGALRENYFLDDGAYMAALIVAQLAKLKKDGKTIESLIKSLNEPLEAAEIRYKINTENFKDYGENVLQQLKNAVENTVGFTLAPDNYEGIRVNTDNNNGDGWFLLRMSLHDPVMPLNIESNSVGGVKIMEKWIADFLAQFDKLIR